MRNKKKVLPDTLYVYVFLDGTTEYYSTEQSLDDCAIPDEKRLVGEYHLTAKHEVSMDIKTVTKKV